VLGSGPLDDTSPMAGKASAAVLSSARTAWGVGYLRIHVSVCFPTC